MSCEIELSKDFFGNNRVTLVYDFDLALKVEDMKLLIRMLIKLAQSEEVWCCNLMAVVCS